MKKILKKALTSLLAVLMAVSMIHPYKVSADSKASNMVTFTATTESGIDVTVVGNEKAYPKNTMLSVSDVDSELVLDYSKKETGLAEIEAQAIDLVYKAGKKTVSVSDSNEATVTFDGVKKNATKVLHLSKFLFWVIVEEVSFEQTGNTITFTHSGHGRYVVVYDRTPNKYDDKDTNVSVVAEQGAFETGTEMVVEEVAEEKIIEAVQDAVENGSVVNAFDISFDLDGLEVQPAEGKEVTVSIAMELDPENEYKLVHIHDGEVEEVEATFTEDGVTFTATSFSIYAVVSTGENACLTVNFWNGSEKIATMRVKNSDRKGENSSEKINKIIYDPGTGTIKDHELFQGWTMNSEYTISLPDTEKKTIQGVRDYILSITTDWAEGDELNLYAVIYKYHTILYYSIAKNDAGDKVSLGSDTAITTDRSANEISFTIPREYMTSKNTQKFDGWTPINNTDSYIKDDPSDTNVAQAPYQINDKVILTGDVVVQAVVSDGHWLVFDEVLRGATYNAPRFYEHDEVTSNANLHPMERVGYTFDDWYEAASFYTEEDKTNGLIPEKMDVGDPKVDENGNIILKTTPFVFGKTLSENTTIYAKWNKVTSARYTVIIWKQNVDGKTYDFEESIPLNGTPDTVINTVTQQGSGNNAYARIDGTNKQYTGFYLKKFDQDVKIAPEGGTVLNVYYDRIEHTLTFQINESSVSYEPYTGNSSGYHYVQDENGDYVEVYVTRSGNTWSYQKATGTEYIADNSYGTERYGINSSGEYFRIYYNNWNWRTTNSWNGTVYNGQRYRLETTYETVYVDTVYNQVTSSWTTIKEITALYQQNISSHFPIVGTNGVTYNNGERWAPTSNTPYSNVLVFIDIMPNADVTFRLNTSSASTKHIHYYVEALPGDTNTRTYNGKQFVEYKSINAKYNFFTEPEDYLNLVGYSKSDSYPPEAYNSNNQKQNTVWNNGNAIDVYCYYLRDVFSIFYNDGIYVDGNDNVILDQPDRGELYSIHDIRYNTDLATYNKDKADYYNPETDEEHKKPVEGYVFEGWYVDKTCQRPYTFNKMNNNITVYAKWRQIQYRVFLHSNAKINGEFDDSLTWGSSNVSMSFRVSYGGKVSLPTGKRAATGYEMFGWYYDENSSTPFGAPTVLNNLIDDKYMPYNKDERMTDTANIHGEMIDPKSNSDKTGYNGGDRFWITKTLDLYAGWTGQLVGAIGINVEYDVTELGDATTAPVDNILYQDNAKPAAQSAATPNDTSAYQFEYWIVQKWNETNNKWEDTSEIAYPGGQFTVRKDDAHIHDIEYGTDSETGEQIIVSQKYTVRLKAYYMAKTPLTPTHITFYGNGGTVVTGKVPASTEALPVASTSTTVAYPKLHINETVDALGADVFDRPGFTFIGWARETEPTGAFDINNSTVNANAFSQRSGLSLWLKLNADGSYSELDEYGTVVNANVTQIAADENDPYHALYAVWEKTFYVYHSFTQELEAVTIDVDTYNLVDHVSEGTIYGGYYKGICNFTSTIESKKGDALAATTHKFKVAETQKYDGSALKYNGENFWTNEMAYKDVKGSELVPKPNTVYYLKEVPEEYLNNTLKYLQYNDLAPADLKNVISDIYLLTTVDDNLYSAIGFIKTGSDNPVSASLVNKVVFQQRHSDTETKYIAGYDGTLPAGIKVLNSGIKHGYIGYIHLTPETFGVGSEVTVEPYWTTLDGVQVKQSSRTFTIASDKKSISEKSN